MELRNGEGVVQLLFGEAQQAAHAGSRAERAVGAGAVHELVEVLGGKSAAHSRLIAHHQGGQVLFVGHALLQCRGQHAAHKRGAGVALNHVVAVVNVKGVGSVGHGHRGT